MDIQASPTPECTVSNASYGIIDPLTTTAEELQELLTSGSLTSLDLINIYLGQIEQHNKNGLKLNAIISTAPQHIIAEQARLLDAERAAGSIRGPLHGIPVVVKDNVMTDSSLGMDTTCGSYALVGAKAPNAPIADRLLKAGMIIIAKANLSVSNFMRALSWATDIDLHIFLSGMGWLKRIRNGNRMVSSRRPDTVTICQGRLCPWRQDSRTQRSMRFFIWICRSCGRWVRTCSIGD